MGEGEKLKLQIRNLRGVIIALSYIVAGGLLFWKINKIVGLIIILGGVGISMDVINWIKLAWDFINKLPIFGDKEKQKMEGSPGALQQQAKRDAIVGEVVNTGKIIQNISINNNQEDYEKRVAFKIIYKKMVQPLRTLNLAATIGVKNKEEFNEISKSIEEFINTKMENELELDEGLLNKLNEVMGAFRHTKNELYIKIQKNKFDEGLHGLKSFDFVMKCKEATEEIKKRLNTKPQEKSSDNNQKVIAYNKLNEILKRANNRHLSDDEKVIDFLSGEIKEIRKIFENSGHLLSSEICNSWDTIMNDKENKDILLAVDFSTKVDDLTPLKVDKQIFGIIQKELGELK